MYGGHTNCLASYMSIMDPTEQMYLLAQKQKTKKQVRVDTKDPATDKLVPSDFQYGLWCTF